MNLKNTIDLFIRTALTIPKSNLITCFFLKTITFKTVTKLIFKKTKFKELINFLTSYKKLTHNICNTVTLVFYLLKSNFKN